MKLLLVDDNYADMKEFVDLLSLEGHKVEHVHNSAEAEEICTAKPEFDGILLDLMFPPEVGIPVNRTDFGYSAGRYLYVNLIYPAFPLVPFIILTAMDSSTAIYQQVVNDLKKQYKTYRGCIQKPPKVNEVIDTLRNAQFQEGLPGNEHKYEV